MLALDATLLLEESRCSGTGVLQLMVMRHTPELVVAFKLVEISGFVVPFVCTALFIFVWQLYLPLLLLLLLESATKSIIILSLLLLHIQIYHYSCRVLPLLLAFVWTLGFFLLIVFLAFGCFNNTLPTSVFAFFIFIVKYILFVVIISLITRALFEIAWALVEQCLGVYEEVLADFWCNWSVTKHAKCRVALG